MRANRNRRKPDRLSPVSRSEASTPGILFSRKIFSKPLLLLCGAIVIFVIIFSAVPIYKYAHYVDCEDAAVYEGSLWHFLQGRGFWTQSADQNMFAQHFEAIAVVYLAFYYIFTSIHTLFILQTLFAALAAIPLYYLARRILHDEVLACLIGIFYLIYPATSGFCVNGFHYGVTAIIFLVLLFLFYELKSTKGFCLCLVCILLCKEDHGILVALLGLYFLLYRKDWQKGILCIFLGLSWFIVITKVVMIKYLGGIDFINDVVLLNRYPTLGGSLSSIVKNTFLHPVDTFGFVVGNPQKMKYIMYLFGPHFLIPLLHWPLIVAILPLIAQNTLADFTGQFSLIKHYTATMIPVIFYAYIMGLRKLGGWLPPRKSRQMLRGIVLASLAVTAVMFYYSETFDYSFRDKSLLQTKEFHGTRLKAIKEIEELVPPEDSLLVSRSLEPHFTHRSEGVFAMKKYNNIEPKYLLLDAECVDVPIRYPDLLKFIQRNYNLVHEKENIFFFASKGNISFEGLYPKVAWDDLRQKILLAQIIAYQKLVADYPKQYLIFRNKLAEFYMYLNDMSSVVLQWQLILQEDPLNVPTHLNLGLAAFRAGNVKMARKYWNNVLAIEPKHQGAKEMLEQIRD